MKKKPHPAGVRNKHTTTVKDAMSAMLKSYNINIKFDETNLITAWEKIMGKAVANRTSKIYVKDSVLIITMNSAPLKHELNNSKAKVLALFEKEFGRQVVKDVLFI
jgi:hypothetical protein